jgi:hypothetical protein
MRAGDFLVRLWCRLFPTRPLRPEEVAASEDILGPCALDHALVRVHEGSPLAALASAWTGRPTAVATFHLVHAGREGLDLPSVVHELAHVAQYERAGAAYLWQALRAQHAEGYDYGDLDRARADGRRFRHLNREQQAQLCEDVHRLRRGLTPVHGATLEAAAPFLADLRRGEW